MKLSPHSFATAPASKVLPVPGAPYSSSPDRNLRGQLANSSGYWQLNDGYSFRGESERVLNIKKALRTLLHLPLQNYMVLILFVKSQSNLFLEPTSTKQ